MEILGVGPLEFVFILLIALIVLGPKDMVKAGRTLGRFLRKLVTSPEWRAMQQASRELSRLPNRLMREAGLEEANKMVADVQRTGQKSVVDSLKDVNQWQEDVAEDDASHTIGSPDVPSTASVSPSPDPATPPRQN